MIIGPLGQLANMFKAGKFLMALGGLGSIGHGFYQSYQDFRNGDTEAGWLLLLTSSFGAVGWARQYGPGVRDFWYGLGNRGSIPIGDVPYKESGGSERGDFVSSHAADRHAYDPSRTSTKSRTQYGENVDVSALITDTMRNPDIAYSTLYSDGARITTYKKQYLGNISTPDTPTGSHRVHINLTNQIKSSNHPYYRSNS